MARPPAANTARLCWRRCHTGKAARGALRVAKPRCSVGSADQQLCLAAHSLAPCCLPSGATSFRLPSRRPFCSWHSALDTKLVPQHFSKHKEGAGAQKQALSRLGALKGKQTANGAGAPAGHAHGGAVDVQGKSSKRGGAPAGPPAKGGAVGKVVSAVVKGAAKGSAKARREAAMPPNVVVAHLGGWLAGCFEQRRAGQACAVEQLCNRLGASLLRFATCQ